jgi:hypothetical protein
VEGFYDAVSAETILYQMVGWFRNHEVVVAKLGYFPGRRDSQFSREAFRKFTLKPFKSIFINSLKTTSS